MNFSTFDLLNDLFSGKGILLADCETIIELLWVASTDNPRKFLILDRTKGVSNVSILKNLFTFFCH